ncbi:hypothetical protein [Acinetobacter baumannii]|uniref:hypothetical protein n=1 Tax=Acinetobacter baumannii TaxID=470 RepID=UPI00070D4D87|nr:hypothetical protein [Acinetobacter baumannii]KRI65813.1 hypothetical protein APC61_05965 [Acinetobacter baumannii]QBR82512.1 hypothetical protein E4K02_18390 [Acinetobacter baumannii]
MNKCSICQDTGIVFVGCCSGNQCGCMGMPVAAKNCKCGQPINEEKMSKDELFIFAHVEYEEQSQ